MGPWRHSQVNYDGSNARPAEVARATPRSEFRRDVLKPFFDQYLKDGRAAGRHAAGVHLQHRREPLGPLADLAAGVRRGLRGAAEAALSHGGLRARLREAGDGRGDVTIYVSDPAKPVPYMPRPVRFADGDRWRTWLVTDQRFVADRPDVLTYSDARAHRAGADRRRAGGQPASPPPAAPTATGW